MNEINMVSTRFRRGFNDLNRRQPNVQHARTIIKRNRRVECVCWNLTTGFFFLPPRYSNRSPSSLWCFPYFSIAIITRFNNNNNNVFSFRIAPHRFFINLVYRVNAELIRRTLCRFSPSFSSNVEGFFLQTLLDEKSLIIIYTWRLTIIRSR